MTKERFEQVMKEEGYSDEWINRIWDHESNTIKDNVRVDEVEEEANVRSTARFMKSKIEGYDKLKPDAQPGE